MALCRDKLSDSDERDCVFATEYAAKAGGVRVLEKRQRAQKLLEEKKWVEVLALCKGECDPQLVANMHLAESSRIEEKRISVKRLIANKDWQEVISECNGETDDVLAGFAEKAKNRLPMLAMAAQIDEEYLRIAEENFLWMTNGLSALRRNYVNEKDLVFLQNSFFSMDRATSEKKTREDLIRECPWANVIRSRRGVSNEVVARGNALLEEFGNSYLPNAYANLKKAKERVWEIQLMFNREFAEPWKMENTMPEWTAFEKILRKLTNAKVNYFRLHDELCHYYLMYKVGALSAEDLAGIDSERLILRLLVEMPSTMDFTKPWHHGLMLDSLTYDGCSFAEKNMPETYAIYQVCKNDLNETEKLIKKLDSDMRCMDMVRFDLSLIACREKADYTIQTINKLVAAIKGWHAEFRIMEKSVDDLAKLDHETAIKWKDFADALPLYVKERANGPIVTTNSKLDKYYPCNNFLTGLCAVSVLEPFDFDGYNPHYPDVKWWKMVFDSSLQKPYTSWEPTDVNENGAIIYSLVIHDGEKVPPKSHVCDDDGFVVYDSCLEIWGDKISHNGSMLIDRLNVLDEGKATYSIVLPAEKRGKWRQERLCFEIGRSACQDESCQDGSVRRLLRWLSNGQ